MELGYILDLESSVFDIRVQVSSLAPKKYLKKIIKYDIIKLGEGCGNCGDHIKS